MMHQELIVRAAEQRLDEHRQTREENADQLEKLRKGTDFNWTKVERPARLAERARRLGLFEDAAALLREPDNVETGNRIFEKILGANNLLNVNFLFEGALMARAVGRITLPVPGGRRLGTGFMVSSRIMMTNNHVLDSAGEAENVTLEFDFHERENGETGPITPFRLQPDLFFVTDEPLDFTLVAVRETNRDGVSVSGRGWFPLVGPSGKAVIGERVSIIQHPNGDPQKVTLHDNKVVDVVFESPFLHYETDTMGGSSGSPVLNIDWDLVALHHAAVGNSNEGVRISAIVTRLQEIFSSEAAQADAGLAADLMAAAAPRRSPAYRDPVSDATPPTPTGPRINPDGTASWVVPMTLTLGVGNGPLRGAQPQVSVPGIAGASAVAPPGTDTLLQDSLRAVEAAAGRVYYSEVKDREAREAYYPNLAGLRGTELYDTLSDLLARTHTTTLSYKTARLTHLYPWIDRREGSQRPLRGIYSNDVFDVLEVIQREVEMERQRERAIREHLERESLERVDETFLESLEAAFPFNCEHVVPQSWFNKRKQPKTDLHHLFTCEWGCNSFRGNRAYFDFHTEAFREDCGESDDSKFEPKHGKGAVARATLYFLLRYPGDIADSNKEMPRERLNTVIEWAKGDKVDRWERHRNAEIQKIQGNRNPLIDFPDLVDEIDFERGWA